MAGGSPSAASSGSSTPTSSGLTITDEGHIGLPSANVGPLALDDRTVLFPFASDGSSDWDSVARVDFDTKAHRTVARTEFPQGFINWVDATGDWVTWTDQARRQADDAPKVLWRVWAKNLRTDKTVLLATNKNIADPYVPQVHAQDDVVYWTQAEANRTAREFSWKAGAGQPPKAILRHAEMTPGSETSSNGDLVYLSKSAKPGGKGHTTGGDCWTVPLDGTGRPTPLTRTGLAMGCSASDDTLVWTQHIDPHQRPLPPEGVLDDPYEIHASNLDGSHSYLVHRGYLSIGYPIAGSDFVAWQTARSGLIRSLSTRESKNLPHGAVAPSFRAGDGKLFAYIQEAKGAALLRLLSVDAPS